MAARAGEAVLRSLVLGAPELAAPASEVDHSVGRHRWPRTCGANLGTGGAFNLLWRLGVIPKVVDSVGTVPPERGDVLYVSAEGALPGVTERSLRAWLGGGGRIVATGSGEAWMPLLEGVQLQDSRVPNPYAGLAYVLGNRKPELVAPQSWSWTRAFGAEGGRGALAMLHGERQTPSRALVTPLDEAPVLLRREGILFLNARPFAALQAWLQGQEDLSPWFAYRHRLFWLDELSSFLGDVLEAEGFLPQAAERPGIPGLGKTTVVLRHDLDSSRDTAYLDEESARGMSGVHAVLRDLNTKFWTRTLARNPAHESAFHYNTIASTWAGRKLEALRRRPSQPYRPARSDIAKGGLSRQVRWARSRGIGIETLHRHGAFLMYPEWIDALDGVFEEEPALRGGSSLFRAQVLRWGADRADGASGSIGEFPDAQFPFWLPLRLAHAGRGGRLLRGFETASLMESEPELVAQLLDHHVPGLPQRVFVLNYHPAHARGEAFAPGGSLAEFRRVLDLLEARRVPVETLASVLARAQRALEPAAGPAVS